MKKLILVFCILILTGCNQTSNQTSNENSRIISSDKTLEDILERTEGSETEFSFVDTYFSFSDLINDDYPEFYYGKVKRIEHYSTMVQSLYFDVYKSENNEVLGEIMISIANGQTRLIVGEEAVLYLSYIESNSYYGLAAPYKGIFLIEDEKIYFSKDFDDLYNEIANSKEKFFEIVFE